MRWALIALLSAVPVCAAELTLDAAPKPVPIGHASASRSFGADPVRVLVTTEPPGPDGCFRFHAELDAPTVYGATATWTFGAKTHAGNDVAGTACHAEKFEAKVARPNKPPLSIAGDIEPPPPAPAGLDLDTSIQPAFLEGRPSGCSVRIHLKGPLADVKQVEYLTNAANSTGWGASSGEGFLFEGSFEDGTWIIRARITLKSGAVLERAVHVAP